MKLEVKKEENGSNYCKELLQNILHILFIYRVSVIFCWNGRVHEMEKFNIVQNMLILTATAGVVLNHVIIVNLTIRQYVGPI